MNLRWAAAGLAALVLGCGCGSSTSATSAADASVKRDLLRGVAVIRATQDRKRLETQLGSVVASLRGERGSTAAVERARKIVLVGFEIFVAALQAFIFAILSASYIGQAMAEEH